MLVILGIIVVFGSVLGGYLGHGGHFQVLVQPTEYLIICGAGFGALLISAPMSVLKMIMKQLLHSVTGKNHSKPDYVELLMLLFELCKKGKTDLLGLESHVENPESSDIFSRYPSVLKNHHAISFICDTLKVQISSPLTPTDLEEMLDLDIRSMHEEEERAPSLVTKVGDSMPGLGIVAAVVGVIITMGKLTQGKEVIGHSVAAALVGTFLGVLLSYGLVNPLASKMEGNISNDGAYLKVIKTALLAFAKNCSPKICVEYARRSVPPDARPSFKDIDEGATGAGKKAA
ncbi:MAG: flagellar motor stator protein MotA [Bdellovibrionales bacterium RIFOXYD1_FULL_53_11]|nr:MAG: flagellar motor stator protein MotA [Bdellovibrionales bacterium RIFOXYD1_FULL_53_11]